MLLNFSASLDSHDTTAVRINATGAAFVELLADLEQLLGTDTAFMLGPWLASARALGGSATDCVGTQIAGDIGRCDDFMEWNARAQLTTWYPVVGSESAPVMQQNGRDHDYARKQCKPPPRRHGASYCRPLPVHPPSVPSHLSTVRLP